jgi:hypothetical protein
MTRKLLLALCTSLVLMLTCAGVSMAEPPHGTTPHNENGNRYLDVYWTDSFDGAMAKTVKSYYEPVSGLEKAPLLRRVLDLDAADVHVFKQPCVDDGNSESFFQHSEMGVDKISVGACVLNPVYILEHENLHAESMGHHGDLCDDLIIDETVGIKSYMCRKRTEIAKLPKHDKADLRSIPNKREGFESFRASGVGGDPNYRIEETFPTTIPAYKAD